MISQATIVSMVVWIVFSFILFAGLIVFFRRKTGISVKPLIVGAIGFIVITQVLEKALHLVMMTNFPEQMANPWFFSVYGAMAAGVFEEFGRYLLIIWLLKKYLDYRGGVSFGVGWGGIEAVVITLMVALPYMIFSLMINAGTFEATLGAQLPADQLVTLQETLLSQGPSFYLFMGVERFFAALLQIALSLFVLLAVAKQKFSYVIYAVFIHAAIDFPFALWQAGYIESLWTVEIYLAVLGLLSLVFIKKARQLLP